MSRYDLDRDAATEDYILSEREKAEERLRTHFEETELPAMLEKYERDCPDVDLALAEKALRREFEERTLPRELDTVEDLCAIECEEFDTDTALQAIAEDILEEDASTINDAVLESRKSFGRALEAVSETWADRLEERFEDRLPKMADNARERIGRTLDMSGEDIEAVVGGMLGDARTAFRLEAKDEAITYLYDQAEAMCF